MFQTKSWKPSYLRDRIKERVFGHTAPSLIRVDTNSSRNFKVGTLTASPSFVSQSRDSRSTANEEELARLAFQKMLMEEPLPALPTAEEEEATNLRVKQVPASEKPLPALPAAHEEQAGRVERREILMEKPLPALPSTEIPSCLLPAGGSRGNTLTTSTSTTHHDSVAPEADGLGISVHRVDTPGPTAVCKSRKPDGDDWATIASHTADEDEDEDDADDNDGNDDEAEPDPNNHIPVRLINMKDSKLWPGHVVVLFNPDFLIGLKHVLKAHKAYDRAKANAELNTRVSQKLTSHLQMQIARCEQELENLNPDNRLSTQCNGLDNLPSAPNTNASRAKASLATFRRMLEYIETRRESGTASLEKQACALYLSQLGINANFEQAFLSGEMLKPSDISSPSPVQESDVDLECQALCSRFGVQLRGDGEA
jgi:hypothetical protein